MHRSMPPWATPFRISLALFACWCVLPVFGVGVFEARDQLTLEHWYIAGLELTGGAAVGAFVFSDFYARKFPTTSLPPEDHAG